MSSKQNLLAIAGIVSGALVWGLIWYPYRVLDQAGTSGPLATLITYVFALTFGSFMLPKVWRELPTMGAWAILLALTIGWTNLAYVLAILEGEVIRVLLLFYLAPLWTVIFSRFLLNERLSIYGYLIIALSLSGAFVMLWDSRLGLPLPQNGAEWMAMSAGICFALSNVISRKAQHLSIETKSCAVWIGTGLLTAPFLIWQGNLLNNVMSISANSWLILVLLGLVLCSVSFCVQYGVSHLPANRASLLFLSELVFAAISAYFLAQEDMSIRDWIGALLIVSASLFSSKLYRNKP